MRKISPVILLATLCIAASPVALARGGSGGGSPGGPSGASGSPHFGGPSSNSQAAANSNGRFATDRDTGQDRAADRMSDQGKAHRKDAADKKKGKASANAATRATPATRAIPAEPKDVSHAIPAVPATPASPAVKP